MPTSTRSSSSRARPTAELDPATYGFTEADYDRKIFIDHVLGLEFATIPEMLAILQRPTARPSASSSCTSPIRGEGLDPGAHRGPDKGIAFTREGKRAILNKLVEAEGFEKFLDVKFTGTKRFGLDGGEVADPGARADHQARRRARRARTSCSAWRIAAGSTCSPRCWASRTARMFHEFKGGSSSPDEVEGSGDVKYHLGASSDREFDGNKVHLSLTANPSHLEIVDPVVLGKVRAKQDQLRRRPRSSRSR